MSVNWDKESVVNYMMDCYSALKKSEIMKFSCEWVELDKLKSYPYM